MRCLAISAVYLCLSAHALGTPVVTVPSARFSQNYIEWFAGFAIVSDSGSDGAGSAGLPSTYGGFLPTVSAVSGAASGVLTYNDVSHSYGFSWGQTQDYTVTANALMSNGARHLQSGGDLTFGLEGWNYQILEFEVTDNPVDYHLLGTVSGGERFNFEFYNSGQAKWFPVFVGVVTGHDDVVPFDRTGTLNPGLYRLRNNQFSLVADASPSTWDAAWNWQLQFTTSGVAVHNTAPEPSTAVLLIAVFFGGSSICRRSQVRGSGSA